MTISGFFTHYSISIKPSISDRWHHMSVGDAAADPASQTGSRAFPSWMSWCVMPGMDSSFTGVPCLSQVNTFILTLNMYNKTLKDISGGHIFLFWTSDQGFKAVAFVFIGDNSCWSLVITHVRQPNPRGRVHNWPLTGVESGWTICVVTYYRPHRSCSKVMFLHMSVMISTGG